MSDRLIKHLKNGHETLRAALCSVEGVVRSYTKARVHLRALQEHLLQHWEWQDERFWDKLAVTHINDRQATKMLEFLTVNLKDVKLRYAEFFEKYTGETGEVVSGSFPKDFMDFAGEIMARIKVEREYLIPLLEAVLDE